MNLLILLTSIKVRRSSIMKFSHASKPTLLSYDYQFNDLNTIYRVAKHNNNDNNNGYC